MRINWLGSLSPRSSNAFDSVLCDVANLLAEMFKLFLVFPGSALTSSLQAVDCWLFSFLLQFQEMYHEVIDTLDIFPVEADFFLSYSIVLLVKNLEKSLTVADLMDVFPEDEVAVDLETRGVHHEVHRGAVSPLVQTPPVGEVTTISDVKLGIIEFLSKTSL